MNRPNYEEAKKLVTPSGDPLKPDGVSWDQQAPKTPPTPEQRAMPEWFTDVYRFISQLVADESLVLDLCLERCIEIVEFNHNRGLVGIDHFPELQQGSQPTRISFVVTAAPMAVKLYEQVLASLNGPQKAQFEELVGKALEKRQAAGGGAS